ncbi:MAG: hypothetical protein ACI9S8_002030 [Chlamydiales bacterium]|jgi:hypothetical protein
MAIPNNLLPPISSWLDGLPLPNEIYDFDLEERPVLNGPEDPFLFDFSGGIDFNELLDTLNYEPTPLIPQRLSVADFKILPPLDCMQFLVRMFEDINRNGGKENCGHCAMQVHRILKGTDTFEDLFPAPTENANLFSPSPPLQDKSTTRGKLTDERILSVCLKAFSEIVTIDLRAGAPVENIQSLDFPQIEKGVRLPVCNRTELTGKLLDLPRNKNGQTRGFLFYTHRNNIGIGHVNNFFVNGDAVYYIDGQRQESNPVSLIPDFRNFMDDRVCYLQDSQDIPSTEEVVLVKSEFAEPPQASSEAEEWFLLGLVEQNAQKSIGYLGKAAFLEHSDAQFFLSQFCKDFGDLEQSSKWLLKAIQNKNKKALEYLKVLNSTEVQAPTLPSNKRGLDLEDGSSSGQRKKLREDEASPRSPRSSALFDFAAP